MGRVELMRVPVRGDGDRDVGKDQIGDYIGHR